MRVFTPFPGQNPSLAFCLQNICWNIDSALRWRVELVHKHPPLFHPVSFLLHHPPTPESRRSLKIYVRGPKQLKNIGNFKKMKQPPHFQLMCRISDVLLALRMGRFYTEKKKPFAIQAKIKRLKNQPLTQWELLDQRKKWVKKLTFHDHQAGKHKEMAYYHSILFLKEKQNYNI